MCTNLIKEAKEQDGLRYKREEASNSGSSTTTYYLYEGNDILYEEGYEGSTRSFCKLNVYVGGLNIGRVKKEGSMERVQCPPLCSDQIY